MNDLIHMPFEGILIEDTRRKHNMKFKQIGHTTKQYGQSFFNKTIISAWNGHVFAEAPSLAVFRNEWSVFSYPTLSPSLTDHNPKNYT